MNCLSCDPGGKGAMALMCSKVGFLEVADIPMMQADVGPDALIQQKVDVVALRALIRGWYAKHGIKRADYGAIEKLQSFGAKTGPVTLIAMGYAAGMVEATMLSYIVKLERPRPQEWKATFGLGKKKSDSVDCARRLYGPQLPRNFRTDKAEAVLIGHWALMRS